MKLVRPPVAEGAIFLASATKLAQPELCELGDTCQKGFQLAFLVEFPVRVRFETGASRFLRLSFLRD